MKTNDLTKMIITWLNLRGYLVWRQNNGAVFSKKRDVFLKNPTHKLGISDIIGFKKSDSRFLAIEVKTKKDKLSLYQEQFLKDVREAGGIAFAVYDTFEDFEKRFNAYVALDKLKKVL